MTSHKSFKAKNTTHMSMQNMRRINQSLSPPYDDCEYTIRFVQKSIKEGRRAGILKISFVHQVDNFNNHYTCWRIDIEVDHYCGYFVFQGWRYYQKTFTAWFVYSGFLSIWEDGGIIRSLMNTEPSMENVQVSSISIFIFM